MVMSIDWDWEYLDLDPSNDRFTEKTLSKGQGGGPFKLSEVDSLAGPGAHVPNMQLKVVMGNGAMLTILRNTLLPLSEQIASAMAAAGIPEGGDLLSGDLASLLSTGVVKKVREVGIGTGKSRRVVRVDRKGYIRDQWGRIVAKPSGFTYDSIRTRKDGIWYKKTVKVKGKRGKTRTSWFKVIYKPAPTRKTKKR
jgi:hypothetical protein